MRWSPDYLTAWGTFFTGVGTLVVAVGALYAASIAISGYREKTQVEKARWLSDLFKQLFVDPIFKPIRQRIDFDDVEEIRGLIIKELAVHHLSVQEQFSQEQKDLLDAFTDYLNFFEFVGLLRKIERLNDADIESLFDYYIRRLAEIDSDHWIRRYLTALGFENLNHLLNRSAKHLFVYGTLKQGYSRNRLISRAGFRLIGEAKIPGLLYKLADCEYPAAKIGKSSSFIHGELYSIPVKKQSEPLDAVDSEEGVYEGLFARVLVQLEFEQKNIRVWAYNYLGAVEDDNEIKTGKFEQHKG